MTRLRWALPAEPTTPPQLTGAAVDASGNIVVGGNNSKLYFFDAAGNVVKSLTVGTIGITAAPSVGPTAIWVASNDGKIYAVALNGSSILNGSGCSTGSASVGTPALSLDASGSAFTGSTTTHALFSARVAGPLCNGTSVGEAFTGSAVVASSGHIFATTVSGAGAQSVRRFTDPGTALLSADWAVAAGLGADVPLSIDGSGRLLVASFDANLYRVTDNGTSGSTASVTTLSGRASTPPLVLAAGDIVVGTVGGAVHRLASTGTALWTPAPVLGAEITGLAAASPLGAADPTLYAGTALGKLSAIRSDGSEAWSGQVASGAVRSPTIAAAAVGGLPTLYAGSSDGSLYAVVVDSGLDTAAPWPKAYHDVRNTGNAGSPLP